MMRILLVPICAALVIAGSAAAQGTAVGFSLKGGINMARITVNPEPDPQPDNLMRFLGGAGLGLYVHPNLSLELDCLYVMKGAKSESDFYTSEVRIDCLVLSPTLRFAPSENGSGIYLLGGAEIGYILKAEGESELISESGTTYQQMDIKDFMTTTDLAVTFGGGFQFGSDSGKAFFIETRYSLGLTDIQESDPNFGSGETPTIFTPEWTTRGIYGMVGIRL